MRKYLIVLIAISLMLGACSAARQKLNPQGNVDYKTAQVYYNQENIEKAEFFYNRVLESNPNHALSMRRMADINLHKGETIPEKSVEYNKAAYELYDSAIEIYEGYDKPTDEERIALRDMKKRREGAWARIYNVAEKEYKDGNTAKAKATYELVSQLNPQRPEPKLRLKDIYLHDMKDNQAAEAIIRDLVKQEPNNVEYLRQAGAFYYNIKDFAKAAEYFERVKQSAPSNLDNLLDLAYANIEIKAYDKALEALNLGLNMQPTNLEFLDAAASAAQAKQDKVQFLAYMERILELRSKEEDFSDILTVLNELEQYDKLIKYAKKWHEWDEMNKIPVQYIIFTATKKGDKAMADAYNSILKSMP